ncbi:MAG TPA: hypothetical protein VGM75_06690 [Pseudonocardiaceae bacterium]
MGESIRRRRALAGGIAFAITFAVLDLRTVPDHWLIEYKSPYGKVR